MAYPVLLDSYISTVCNNISDTLKAIGSYVILILGVILIIVSVVQIAHGFLANGRTAWIMTLGTLLYGGFLIFGGWADITGRFGRLGKNTVNQLIGDMKPTTHTPITGSVGVSGTGEAISGTAEVTGIDTTHNAIAVISDNFFIPFAKAVAVCVGVVLVVFSSIQIAKYLMGKGKAQVSFIKIASMAVLGSILFAATPTDNSAGWTWIVNTAVGITHDTVVGAAEGGSTSQNYGLNKPVIVVHDETEETDETEEQRS